MDRSTVNKLQHQYWVTKQTVYRKLGKKEDDCITASDSELDAKLELFKSIHNSSCAMNKLLDRYQDKLCALAQEQNEMGRFLKEYGKADKSPAGKMMIQMGKSLIYSSQQEIALRPPLLRLYQEVETFRNRAVDDTQGTIQHMEKNRTEYRASLNWMKKVSQELDPDTNKQMEKFRKVQNHVKSSKSQFDKLKLACLQKVDLLAAARCNMFSHALIQYLQAMSKTTSKNAKIFNTLAITFKGHQYFEFSIIKELAEPSKRLAEECGNKPATEELLFDFNDELGAKDLETVLKSGDDATDSTTHKSQNDGTRSSAIGIANPDHEQDLLNLANASEFLETLLGPLDQSPETEKAQDVLDLGLDLGGGQPGDREKDATSNSLINIGSYISKKDQKKEGHQKEGKQSNDVMSLLSGDDFEGLSFDQDSGDTMALLNEILNASNPSSSTLLPSTESEAGGAGDSSNLLSMFGSSSAQGSNSFMPSYLLDLGSLSSGQSAEKDLLNLSGPSCGSQQIKDKEKVEEPKSTTTANKTWYDMFADLDPLGNPDAFGDKEKEDKEMENRYC